MSLVPAVTEMLFAMGAGDEVVGVSSYDQFPPEVASRPKIGALIDPDFERILSLKPDLVIVYGTQVDLIARLQRAGLPLFNYQHAGLADIATTIRALGERIGQAQNASALAAAIERDIDGIRRQVAGRPRPRTALIFGREPGTLRGMYASAGVGFMHDMLVAAGGADVFDDVKRQNLQATAEILLARAPDAIIEAHSGEGWTPERVQRERDVWRALPSLPAVRNGRIHILIDDRLSIPGPRVADAIRLLARVLHPEAFRIGDRAIGDRAIDGGIGESGESGESGAWTPFVRFARSLDSTIHQIHSTRRSIARSPIARFHRPSQIADRR